MSGITNLPADIASMTVAQLAALPPRQKLEIDRAISDAQSLFKAVRTKLDAALEQTYGQQARSTLRATGRDFGTVYVSDGPLQVKFELPKKVNWDQGLLAQIAERIVAAGDKPSDYLDIKLSVGESRYTNWPPVLQEQFAAARTVEPGKPGFTLSLDGEVA